MRDLDQDYGIDGEVEIFEPSGLATGLKFLVQLKATDNPNLHQSLRLWFPNAKANYYHSLDLPVLVIRYHAPTKGFFSRWFHSLDMYYGRRSTRGTGFAFGFDDAWDDGAAVRIRRDVEAYREVRAPRLPRPLRICLTLQGAEVHGIPSYVLRSRLHQVQSRLSHLVAFTESEDTAHTLRISGEKIEIKLGKSYGCTLHPRNGYAPEVADEALHHDVMIALALAIDASGHSLEAAEVAAAHIAGSTLAHKIESAIPLVRVLARANQLGMALEIAVQLLQDGSSRDSGQLFLLLALARRQDLREQEKQFCVRLLQGLAQDLEQRSDPVEAAVFRYNVANLLRSMHRLSEALREYRHAARLDPTYLTRSYYLSEVAGLLFGRGRYQLSVQFYERSLALDNRRATRFLLADANMFLGRFRRAEELFQEALDESSSPAEPEWCLKFRAVAWLREHLQLDEQQRRLYSIPDGFDPSSMADSEIGDFCLTALRSDALSAFAWFNLGGVHHRQGHHEMAARCFLLAGLLDVVDIQAWSNVLALAFNIQDVNLFQHALHVAYRYNGEKFLRAASECVPGNREEFIRILSDALRMLPSTPDNVVVRFHATAGWDELVIDRSPSEGDAQ